MRLLELAYVRRAQGKRLRARWGRDAEVPCSIAVNLEDVDIEQKFAMRLLDLFHQGFRKRDIFPCVAQCQCMRVQIEIGALDADDVPNHPRRFRHFVVRLRSGEQNCLLDFWGIVAAFVRRVGGNEKGARVRSKPKRSRLLSEQAHSRGKVHGRDAKADLPIRQFLIERRHQTELPGHFLVRTTRRSAIVKSACPNRRLNLRRAASYPQRRGRRRQGLLG